MNKTISNALIIRIAVIGVAFFAAMIGISCFTFRNDMADIHLTPVIWAVAVAISSVAYLATFLPIFTIEEHSEGANYWSHLIGGGVAFAGSAVISLVLISH